MPCRAVAARVDKGSIPVQSRHYMQPRGQEQGTDESCLPPSAFVPGRFQIMSLYARQLKCHHLVPAQQNGPPTRAGPAMIKISKVLRGGMAHLGRTMRLLLPSHDAHRTWEPYRVPKMGPCPSTPCISIFGPHLTERSWSAARELGGGGHLLP